MRPVTCAAQVLAIALTAACSSATSPDPDAGSGPEAASEPDVGVEDAVVTLDPYVSQPTAALLGREVVGRATPPFDAPILTFLADDELAVLDAAADVGWGELDLEAIASLAPGTVVTTQEFVASDETLVERLEQVTEVRIVDVAYHEDWRAAVLGVAEQLGDGDEVVAGRIAELDSRITQLREDVEAAGYTASLLNVRGADDVRVYTASCASSLLDDLGFARPDGQPQAPEGDINAPISLERLPEADADVLFTFVGSTGTDPATLDETATGLESNPLYTSLTAVQEGRAHLVEADWWFGCGSLQAAERIVDDVERHAADW